MLDRFYTDKQFQFWLLQIAGWLGLAVVTFLSLTLYYNTIYWQHVAHTLIQSVLGLLVSLPLRVLFKQVWHRSVSVRVAVSSIAVIAAAAVWTYARMMAFMWLDHSEGLLSTEFGGWFYPSFFIFFSWAALYYGIKFYQERQAEHHHAMAMAAGRQDEYLKRLKAESLAKEAQLKMLRYQINPHFLFNTLNAISALVHLKDTDRARQMLVQLSEFLRYSLESDPLQQISLNQELDALMLYLDIERARFSDRLKISVEVTPQARKASVPSLLMQPILENAIKHAVATREEGGSINIQGYVTKGRLILEISDDGPGIADEQEKLGCGQGRGVGLRNTLERLQALYQTDFEFDLRNREQVGAKAIVILPFTAVAQGRA